MRSRFYNFSSRPFHHPLLFFQNENFYKDHSSHHLTNPVFSHRPFPSPVQSRNANVKEIWVGHDTVTSTGCERLALVYSIGFHIRRREGQRSGVTIPAGVQDQDDPAAIAQLLENLIGARWKTRWGCALNVACWTDNYATWMSQSNEYGSSRRD